MISTWAVFWICVAVILVSANWSTVVSERMKYKYKRENNNARSKTKKETTKLH